jgi:hypothetical protein
LAGIPLAIIAESMFAGTDGEIFNREGRKRKIEGARRERERERERERKRERERD